MLPRDSGPVALPAQNAVVLHVTTVPESLGFLRGQLNSLRSHGWQPHVLSAPGLRLEAFAREEGVPAHAALFERSIRPLHDVRVLFQAIRLIRRIRPAVVHAHTPKGGLIGMLAAAACDVPVRIYQVRGLPLETARGPRRRLLRFTERVSCRLAHRVLCDSSSLMRTLLAERLCPPARCSALLGGIGNGVDAAQRFNPSLVTPRAAGLRERLGIDAHAPVVGFVGRLARDKGIAELAQAWQTVRSRHPTARLLLVGEIDERDPAPAAALHALRSDPSVLLPGHIDDIAPCYALMDVVVLPSYREGLPNVPLEAAAMARPVIATRTTGCIDAVRDGVTGTLVPAHAVAPLIAALEAYLSDADLRARHGAAGRAWMLDAFRQEPLWAAQRTEYATLLRARESSPALQLRLGRAARRAFDVAASALALAALAPLMLVIAAAVRVTLGPPVLFRQVRAGRHGTPFVLHKFRTMREAYDARMQPLPPERRVTRLGALLRSTSLDELPQLWDVLRGRMSIVGPRPLLMTYVPLYDQRQARRHHVRPGLTGWAQVNGRNGVSWQDRLEMDAWYVDHATPGLDLRILARTPAVVLSRRGERTRQGRFMEPFDGTRN